jgi:hypothetical protein
MRRLLPACSLALALACVGTTGGELVRFTAAASGPSDAMNHTLDFTSGRGFHVVLTQATLHVGALYLNQSQPVSGAQATNCILPGTYVAEETTGRDIDLLDPKPQVFPDYGDGTTTRARVAEIWLKGPGSINDPTDSTPILTLAGTVDVNGQTRAFLGTLSIGANRLPAVSDPSQPSAHPICKERIVSPILVDLLPTANGTLVLSIDPRPLVANVDFAQLHQFSTDPPLWGFVDDSSDQPSISLYQALRSAGDVYRFRWVP